jgi:outer membrane lipoprotein-sorting protein
VNTLSAKYDLRETKGSEVETAKVTFYYKKPGRYRYEVAQHSTSIKNGSTSTFDTRSRQITSRLGGIGGLVPLKGSLDDARSKSLRGWTLDQTDYGTQFEQFLVPGAMVTGGEVPGVGLVLELQRPARYNGGVDAMRATLDPQRLLPMMIEMTAGGQLVYKKRFSGLQVNPSISADKFNL